MLTLSPATEATKNDWNFIVENAKNGIFQFKWEYMTYHSDKFHNASVIVYKKNKPVSIFPANKVDDIIYSHQGLTFGGLVSLKELHANEIICIVDMLVDFYKKENVKKIIYKKIPSCYAKYPSDEDLYVLYTRGAELVRRDLSSVIEISGKIKFSDSRKSTINKAIKLGVTISESIDFDSFHHILSTALLRHGAKPVHSVSELKYLASTFPENIKLYLANANEESGNELLAGVLIYDYGGVVHTQYMATTDGGRKIGALDFILSSLINEIYNEKKYFSFGISTEDNGNFLNDGLIKQKEGFGARGALLNKSDFG